MKRLKARRVDDSVVEDIWRCLLEVFDQNPTARRNAREAARSLAKMLGERTKRRPGRPRTRPIHQLVWAAVQPLLTDMESVHQRFKSLTPGARERATSKDVADEFFSKSGLKLNHQINAAKLLGEFHSTWKKQHAEMVRELDSANESPR